MKKQFFAYKVKKRDTLSSIAQRVGMKTDELKAFHNSVSSKYQKVYFNNLVGVPVIFLPLDNYAENNVEKERILERPSAVITKNFYSSKYQITEEIITNTKENISINYLVHLDFIKDYNDNVILIERKNFKNKGNVLDDKISNLALKSIESIYPIGLKLSNNGTISSLHQHTNLISRFKSNRPIIEEYYVGEVVTVYLDFFEESISNEVYFLNQLKNTFAFQLLFPNLQWFYAKNKWKENFSYFPNSFPILSELHAEYSHESKKYVYTTIKGKSIENYSLQDVLKGYKPTVQETLDEDEKFKANFTLNYKTCKKTKKLLAAKAIVTLWQKEEIYKEFTVKLTNQ